MTAPAPEPAPTPPAPPAPPAAPPAPATGTSEGSLADRVAGIESKLDQLLGTLHTTGAEHTADRLDRPSTMEEAARREIERAKAEDAAAAAAAQEQSALTQLRADVAALKETPPAAPVRKLTQLMWPGKQ